MNAPRKDSDNRAIIDDLKPKHAAQLNQKIRYETELSRGEKDLEELLAQLEEGWGTRDLNQIREIVKNNYETNTVLVDQFKAALAAVDEGLQAVEAKG
jgi:hypothetical protein|nr:hypothetical protein [Neorhizobium tomejilense]